MTEFEREHIGDRRAEAQAKFRETARWAGGVPYFGYRPVKGRDGWNFAGPGLPRDLGV